MEDRDLYMIKATIFEALCGHCKVKVFETISTTLTMLAIILKNMWRHSTSEISNGFAAQSAISLKRNADKPNVPSISVRFFRRIFGRTHTRQQSLTFNKVARVVGISRGNKEKAWFWTKKIHCAPSYDVWSETCSWETSSRLSIASVKSYYLLIVNRC